MKTKLLSLISVITLSVALAGCNGWGVSKQTVGIAGGAVAGGIIGSAVSGGSATGAVIGAAGGALAGSAIAKHYH